MKRSGYAGPRKKRGRNLILKHTKLWLGCLLAVLAGLALAAFAFLHRPPEPAAGPGQPEETLVSVILNMEETEASVERAVPETQCAVILTTEEYEMLARLVTAEGEDQGMDAQYMIACVVMNRVHSELFPDSVEEVIWQKKPIEQFSSMWDGRFERCQATAECYQAVDYLVKHGNSLPDDVFYFTSDGYLPGTEPYVQVNQMYFSRQR